MAPHEQFDPFGGFSREINFKVFDCAGQALWHTHDMQCNQNYKQITHIRIIKCFPGARGAQKSQELFSKAVGNTSLLQEPIRNIILQPLHGKSYPKDSPNLHISEHLYYARAVNDLKGSRLKLDEPLSWERLGII